MNQQQNRPINIAVLDDYQGAALTMADWSRVQQRATVTVFRDHLVDDDAVVERLTPFDIVCVMRERTPLSKAIVDRLPRLKLIASTAASNKSIDIVAAKERGIEVLNTGSSSSPAVELTWALILASVRHIVPENSNLRHGGWQEFVGVDLEGKTLGILGLGRIGSAVAKIALAFGMTVLAWSRNLTQETANAAGCTFVSKEDLFRSADVISIHLVLSEETRGLVSAREFEMMKSSAYLINASRGAIVVEKDLLHALASNEIAGAAIDVYDVEPLPNAHPYRNAKDLLATPHIGYVTENTYKQFYGDTVDNINLWIDKQATP